jgi:competence protein ComEA
LSIPAYHSILFLKWKDGVSLKDKLTTAEQIAILITVAIIAFMAGYYVRSATFHAALVVEPEYGTATIVAESSQVALEAETTPSPSLAVAAAVAAQETAQAVSQEPVESVETTETADSSGLVNLNTAGLEELETLPGIGPVLAQRIIDYREANGDFQSTMDLINVSGIGEKTYAKIADYVEVGE